MILFSRLWLNFLALGILALSAPAMAQLDGSDTAPGDSCASFPQGATRITADPDNDGTRVTLVCDGTNWIQEGIVVLSKTGGTPASDGNEDGSVTPAGNPGEIQFNDSGTGLGASSNLFWDVSNNRLGINEGTPGVALDVVGDINYTGVLADVSDQRQKTNIQTLQNAVEKIRHINGVSFVMKNDPDASPELGLIAQDVEKVYPELVRTDAQGMKSLNYTGMIGPLVEAVKELDAENQKLREKIQALSDSSNVIKEKHRSRYSPYND